MYTIPTPILHSYHRSSVSLTIVYAILPLSYLYHLTNTVRYALYVIQRVAIH